MMSKERDLLARVLTSELWSVQEELQAEIKQLLAQPEQEPVAWITEWVQRYRHNDTPIMDRAVSFTKCDAPAVPNPNYIPLYTAPPKREPLSEATINYYLERLGSHFKWDDGFEAGVKWAEKAHGIGDE